MPRTDATKLNRYFKHKGIFMLIGYKYLLSPIAILYLASCSRGDSTSREIKGPLGLNFIVEHFTGPPMSAEEDEVYVKLPDKSKKLIFKGYGSRNVNITSHNGDSLIIGYCGGSILKVESSIVNKNPINNSNSLIRIQPITLDNVSIYGNKIC